MIRAVIFDIDGTLIDSVVLHAAAWQAALRHFGHEIPFERVRAQIGKGADKFLPALLPQEEVAQRGQELEQYRLELFRREYLPRVRAFPRVRELFEQIKADGKRIALASSAKYFEYGYPYGKDRFISAAAGAWATAALALDLPWQ
jgi:phosphoglycolate phosphatase-like HAD superfamily hydrolase